MQSHEVMNNLYMMTSSNIQPFFLAGFRYKFLWKLLETMDTLFLIALCHRTPKNTFVELLTKKLAPCILT